MIKGMFAVICILFTNCCFSQPIGFSQHIHVPTRGCQFDFTEMNGDSDISVSEPDNRIEKIWEEILKVSGNEGINAHLAKTYRRKFESFNQNGSAWIIYNSDILSQWQDETDYKWIVAFILGHELAHVALNHNLSTGSNKAWEARADEWACQQLCKMNSDETEAAKALWTFVGDNGIIPGYPTKRERINAVKKYFQSHNCSPLNGLDIDVLYGNGYKRFVFGNSVELIYQGWTNWKWESLHVAGEFKSDEVRYNAHSLKDMIGLDYVPEKQLFAEVVSYNNNVCTYFSKYGFFRELVILWGDGYSNPCPERIRKQIFDKLAIIYQAEVVRTSKDERFILYGKKVILTAAHSKGGTSFSISSISGPKSNDQDW